jgi:dephospho-CoA kinase
MIPILGIVGGIGSGKSLVAEAMRACGGHLISADQLGHEALEQPDIKAKLVARWGDAILDDDGKANRKQIGRRVFADRRELDALEKLVFPYIEMRILEEIARARTQSGVKCIILDAAIMIETGWHRHCDKLVFVDAPRELRLARLKEKRGWDEKEVERREAMQQPADEKKRHAHAVIVNDGEPDKVVRQVKDLLVLWKVIC